ncbi:MAG TPA: hypothetical protein VHB21_19005 [Minicystis sp.]|nr:hypothetical protein [Minicystis sp.]
MGDDDRDQDEHSAARDALQGLGLLFRAGRQTARKIKRQLDKTDAKRSIDDAGKEIARAIDNVVGRIAGEPKKPEPRRSEPPSPPPKPGGDGAPKP